MKQLLLLLIGLVVGCGQATVAETRVSPEPSRDPITFTGKLMDDNRGAVFGLCRNVPDDEAAALLFLWANDRIKKYQGEASLAKFDAEAANQSPPTIDLKEPWSTVGEWLGFIHTDGTALEITIMPPDAK